MHSTSSGSNGHAKKRSVREYDSPGDSREVKTPPRFQLPVNDKHTMSDDEPEGKTAAAPGSRRPKGLSEYEHVRLPAYPRQRQTEGGENDEQSSSSSSSSNKKARTGSERDSKDSKRSTNRDKDADDNDTEMKDVIAAAQDDIFSSHGKNLRRKDYLPASWALPNSEQGDETKEQKKKQDANTADGLRAAMQGLSIGEVLEDTELFRRYGGHGDYIESKDAIQRRYNAESKGASPNESKDTLQAPAPDRDADEYRRGNREAPDDDGTAFRYKHGHAGLNFMESNGNVKGFVDELSAIEFDGLDDNTDALSDMLEQMYLEDDQALSIQTRDQVMSAIQFGDTSTDGERREVRINQVLNSFGLIRTKQQRQFHEAGILGSLQHIHGQTFERGRIKIMKKRKLKELRTEILVVTPRRYGKTTMVAMLAAAFLLCIPGIRIAIFSTGRRASQSLMDLIVHFIMKIDGGKERICLKNQERLCVAATAAVDEKGQRTQASKQVAVDPSTSVLMSLPASETGKHLCFMILHIINI